jgi:hypothetical protein
MSTLSCVALVVAVASGAPGSPVAMRVEATPGKPISRFIYGVNFPDTIGASGFYTLSRLGGNRLSAYNWENNASNCGNDCGADYQNDWHLGKGPAGEAVRKRVQAAFDVGAAFLATVPMLGFVSADVDGPVPLSLPLDKRLARFKVSKARKGAPFVYPPDTRDPFVYQDEFVAWLEGAFPQAKTDPDRRLFYSLDNEPDLWGSTHEEVRGNRLGDKKYVLTGYDELVDKTIEYAAAIKAVAPHALVFGPALSNWNGYQNLYHNDKVERLAQKFFLTYYLQALRRAEQAKGKRLLDVLDVHWYPEIFSLKNQSVTNEWAEQNADMVEARVQAPRTWWDPSFRERSWVADVIGQPIRLIPRLKELIDKEYPGTKLAFTEYYFYRGGDISGGIAQADILGVFGREGVFAATMWGQGNVWAYKGDLARTYRCAFAAFRAYRDFDGKGASFGDLSLAASTQDVSRTSIYASADSKVAGRKVLVVINKTPTGLPASIALPGVTAGTQASLWRISGSVGECSGPEAVPDKLLVKDGQLTLALPPSSITTVLLEPPAT